MTVTPLIKHKKILKRTKKFTRFEYEDFNGKLKPSWRRPRGIDSRIRRQYRGNKPLVKCGYGQAWKTKFLLPNGFKKFLIRNNQDLEILLMNNRVYCGELAHNLGAAARKKIVLRAAELNVKLTNAKGKLVKEEKKN
jgi:large subunit ribosomal protein L32e